jgi:UDP-N-acetylmuramyl tripeptide synthase
MAEAASRWCDVVILTADNSRSEDTEAILDEIEAGMPRDWRRAEPGELAEGGFLYARLPDRARAIQTAVAAAEPGATVVIAGKGHETTQTIGQTVLTFDDRVEASRALDAVAAGRGARRESGGGEG